MRKSFVVACLSSVLFACSGSDTKPALTVTPSGTQTISGPTVVAASEADVTWSLGTGSSGTLSGSTGQQVVYHPSSTPNSTATVTATATDGRTASVTFNVTGAAPALLPGGHIPGLTAAVTVAIDAQGIPHIFCTAAKDCFAVQGFLHAQDRLFEMDLFRCTAEGKLASLIASPGVGSDKQFLALFATRDGRDVMAQMADAIDTDTGDKLNAYVAGVNAYLAFLALNPSLMPGEYAQLPNGPFTPGDIDPWSARDSFAIGRLQQFQLSETIEEETAYGLIAAAFGPTGQPPPHDQSPTAGRFATYVHAQQPIQDYTIPLGAAAAPVAAAQPMNVAPWVEGLAQANADIREMHEMFGSPRLGAGSNNWVISAGKSVTGKALVANDPHLQLFFPPLFHLSAMTATDSSGLDVAGGSFPGVPGALVGRGLHVGWGVTVVGYDVTDLYMEQFLPQANCPGGAAGPPCVLFQGAPVSTIPLSKTIKVRGSTTGVTTNLLVVPHHGPLITVPDAGGKAISMRWTGHEATNDFLGFFGLNTATGVGATDDTADKKTAFGALRNYKVGAQNFVLADDAGNIGYDPHALVPSRPWISQTVLPWLPLPGDGSAEWGGTVDCSKPVPAATCWVDDSLLPQSVNPDQGFLVTANSDPIGTTDDNNPVVNSINGKTIPYLSFDWDDPTTVRFETITKRIKATLAGSVGKISLDDMQRIQSDHTIQLAGLFLDPATHFGDSVPATGNSHTALTILQSWATRDFDCPTGLTGISPTSAPSTDPTVVQNSAACLLFHQFLRTLLNNVFADDFAAVAKLAGQNPGADAGRQIRAMLFMLKLGTTANTPGTEFCNNVNTSGVTVSGGTHSCQDQVNIALNSAFTSIAAQLGPPPAPAATTTSWLWGKFHTLTTLSPTAPLIGGGFSGGPFARPGGALSVDVANPDATQSTPLGFTYSHGSNVRFIGEIQAPASSTILMQLPGVEHDAQFGVFAGPTDMLTPYVGNQYFHYLMNHQVDANAVSSQGFAP